MNLPDPVFYLLLFNMGVAGYATLMRNSEWFPLIALLSVALVFIGAALACPNGDVAFANCFVAVALLGGFLATLGPIMVAVLLALTNHELRKLRKLHDPHWRRVCSALDVKHTHRGHEIEGTYAGFPVKALAVSTFFDGARHYKLVLGVGSYGIAWQAQSVRGRAHTHGWKVTARDQQLKKRLVEGGIERVLRDAEEALDLEHCPKIAFLSKEGKLSYTDYSGAVPSKEAFRSHLDLLVRVEWINREVNAS